MRRALTLSLAVFVAAGLLGFSTNAKADEVKEPSVELQRSLDGFSAGQLLFRGEFTLGFNKLEDTDWSGKQKRAGYRLNLEYMVTDHVGVGGQVGAEYFHDSKLLAIVGPRVAFYPIEHRVRPYFALSAGYAHWNIANHNDAVGVAVGAEVGLMVRLSDDGVLAFLSTGYTFMYSVTLDYDDSGAITHSIPVTLGFGRAF